MVFEKTLTAMVKGIRAHRGTEAEYINSCLQEIKQEVLSTNLATKSMAILKLAYLNMLGYDMSWSTFAVVEVMSHNKFAVKRCGYLASAMCFTENTDVGLLTINLFKKDFGSKSQYESGMAISCLSSICTPEISRDILSDLIGMLSSSRAYLRKKTVLCLYRVFLKDPPALRIAFPKLKERLADEDQGVLTATVNTFLELARKNARNYLSLVPQFYHVLVNTTNNWLSIKLLKVFQLLCPLEPRLPQKMVEPLTNLLNTTKAQSVEFEAIRCVAVTMPEGTAVVALAIEKLQNFLNSSDRNLRYLALELFKEILEKPQFKDLKVPDLHGKVLTALEESDSTARKVALLLLDQIASPATFVDTVKKLMDFSRSGLSPDEFVGTILRMGARDRYALVEDFPWYLLVLAEMARNVESAHASQVAEQLVDISARVAQVRPYAVTLALSLLDGSMAAGAAASGGIAGNANAGEGAAKPAATGKELAIDVSVPVVGACAWLLGEHHGSLEGSEHKKADDAYIKAARALLVPKHIQALEPGVQAQCIWAAAKLYIGASEFAPGALPALSELMEQQLPAFVQSTQVNVSERAALSLHLCRALRAEAAQVGMARALLEEDLKPVHPDTQKSLPVPEGLGLDEPFFVVEDVVQATYAPVRADPADPYSMAATYKDDLGFLAAREKQGQPAASPGGRAEASSMFYLKSKDPASSSLVGAEGVSPQAASSATGDAAAPADALQRMRAQLRSGGTKFEVMRDDVVLPSQQLAAGASAATQAVAGEAGCSHLPVPPEKELGDLQGRLWAACFLDEHLGVYACVRSKNARKQLQRIDLRLERIAGVEEGASATASVTCVSLVLPDGVSAAEASGGAVALVAGELQERSAKVKINLGLAPFVAPVTCTLDCELRYTLTRNGAAQAVALPLQLQLPATSCLSPALTTEDEIAEYIAQNRELLREQVCQTASLAPPGRDAAALTAELPSLVGRCVGLCSFTGIQQRQAPGKDGQPAVGQKFLLVAQPPAAQAPSALPGQTPLPQGSLIVCLCACKTEDGQLDIRLTVKSARQDVSTDVCAQLVATFRELIEGRLRAAP